MATSTFKKPMKHTLQCKFEETLRGDDSSFRARLAPFFWVLRSFYLLKMMISMYLRGEGDYIKNGKACNFVRNDIFYSFLD